MQNEKIVKAVIAILAMVVMLYMIYMFYTQANGQTKWVLYPENKGIQTYINPSLSKVLCMEKILPCAMMGGSTDFSRCNEIERTNTCDTFCKKYCEEKGKGEPTCGGTWQHMKAYFCSDENYLYEVSIIKTKKTTQDNKQESPIIIKIKNKNNDKLNILTYDKPIKINNGESIKISILENPLEENLEMNCYVIYLSSEDNINITKIGKEGVEIYTPGTYLISTACLLSHTAGNGFMDNACRCSDETTSEATTQQGQAG